MVSIKGNQLSASSLATSLLLPVHFTRRYINMTAPLPDRSDNRLTMSDSNAPRMSAATLVADDNTQSTGTSSDADVSLWGE